VNALDLLNAAAMLCNGLGLLVTVLVYKRPDSRVFLYNKSERPALAKRDAQRHRMVVAGFVALGVGFVLQVLAQLLHTT
jgi:hypothetical protein